MGARLSGRSLSASRPAGRTSTRHLSCGWGQPEAKGGAGVPGRRAGVRITPVGIFHPLPSWGARDPPTHLIPSKTDESPGDGCAPERDPLVHLRGGPPVQVAPLRGTRREESCVPQPPTPAPTAKFCFWWQDCPSTPGGLLPMPPLPSAHLPSAPSGASECPHPMHTLTPASLPYPGAGRSSRRPSPVAPVESWTPTSHAEPGLAKAGSFSSHSAPPVTGRQEPPV